MCVLRRVHVFISVRSLSAGCESLEGGSGYLGVTG